MSLDGGERALSAENNLDGDTLGDSDVGATSTSGSTHVIRERERDFREWRIPVLLLEPDLKCCEAPYFEKRTPLVIIQSMQRFFSLQDVQ